ncbi:DUF4394 domain-containing protein [Hymenobacter radiodurans]|uniref:DUF4394 domain-containing protein n=1 Tax=Hymenobacter radiodurans TaxID=2496028 RepID=UPI003742AA74
MSGLGNVLPETITGLPAGERLIGLDFRPATGQLYALSASSVLYTLNAATAAATPVAPLSIPIESNASIGFDFNPVADRIRIVTNTGQNLRVNPVDGVTIADTRLNPSEPGIQAAAYTNNVAGATGTELYVIGLDPMAYRPTQATLYRQTPPNDGTLVRINTVSLQSWSYGTLSFDIGAMSNRGYLISLHIGGTKFITFDFDRATGRILSQEFQEFNFREYQNLSYQMSGFTVGLGF